MSTLRELVEAATQKEADHLFERYVLVLTKELRLRERAIAMARSNIGYFAGYYPREMQLRVEMLYGAIHPIFGPVGGPDEPKTIEETLQMGIELGKQMKREVDISSTGVGEIVTND